MRKGSRTAKGHRPQVPVRGRGEVLLAWARDRDGAKVNAAWLGPADRRGRAPFTCLGCAEPLVPHLGRIRARHFAHRPGSRCPLTAPESALHLDAKERLLALCDEAFRGTRQVTLLSRCPSCRRPVPRDLAAMGDGAVEEGAVGPLRADVLVRSRGKAALAFEVKVTHALEAEKEAALAIAGVPALEIDARGEWAREAGGGVEIAPCRTVGFPPCGACLSLARAEADRLRGGEAAEIAELEAYRARGLFGPTPPPSPRLRRGEGGDLALAEGLDAIARRFRCPDCGGRELIAGEAILRHAWPDGRPRLVAALTCAGRAPTLRRGFGFPPPPSPAGRRGARLRGLEPCVK